MYDNVTITYGGSGGTAVVAPSINHDNYSSEFFKKSTGYETRVRIKHIKENAKAGQPVLDRHTVTVTQTVYPTEDAPNGFVREVIFTIRNQPNDTESAIIDLGEAVAFLASSTFMGELINWQS